MGKYLNVGNAGFVSAVKGIYVDKSEMISYINSTLGTADKLTCVSRPRRFGKSFAAKMLCAYYDKSCDSRALFEGLAISQNPLFEKNLNKFNVIYLDITLFISKALNVQNTVDDISNALIEELQQAYPNVQKDTTLADMLYNVTKETGEKFIMIIDEWDALFREAQADVTFKNSTLTYCEAFSRAAGQTTFLRLLILQVFCQLKNMAISPLCQISGSTQCSPRRSWQNM